MYELFEMNVKNVCNTNEKSFIRCRYIIIAHIYTDKKLFNKDMIYSLQYL